MILRSQNCRHKLEKEYTVKIVCSLCTAALCIGGEPVSLFFCSSKTALNWFSFNKNIPRLFEHYRQFFIRSWCKSETRWGQLSVIEINEFIGKLFWFVIQKCIHWNTYVRRYIGAPCLKLDVSVFFMNYDHPFINFYSLFIPYNRKHWIENSV